MATFRKRSGGWRAEVCIKGIRRSATFTTKREAQAWAAQEETRLREDSAGMVPNKPFRDLPERYGREVSSKKRGAMREQRMIGVILQLGGMEEDPMQQLLGHSITYRVAVGPQQGRKVFTLQTVPATKADDNAQAAKESGFSLHAGVVAQHWGRKRLERLCRYITRPAISEKRLSITPAGNIRYQLKTPYRDGTTHVIFEPMDFLARLAALVPKPRVNLTRFHGVFAANSRFRSEVMPGRRGKASNPLEKSPAERRRAMNWAQRLKRVFNIDVEVCSHCGGRVRLLACIEDQPVIDQILNHLNRKGTWLTPMSLIPEGTGPPAAQLF